MAHFAQIDENNIVVQVVVISNNDESTATETLAETLGGRWIQTSYNRTFRKNFAGIGMIYDEERDAFYSPKPFPSWTLNEETCEWEPPTPRPAIVNFNVPPPEWDESTLSWI